MQVELLNRKRWNTRIELATAIFEYIEVFYNRQRRVTRHADTNRIRASTETDHSGVILSNWLHQTQCRPEPPSDPGRINPEVLREAMNRAA
jgi:Integrase core domain